MTFLRPVWTIVSFFSMQGNYIDLLDILKYIKDIRERVSCSIRTYIIRTLDFLKGI